MALTQQQIQELNIAQQRVLNGTASQTDKANLDYAKRTFGFMPTTQTQQTQAPTTQTSSFSPQQALGLNAAYTRTQQGAANETDRQNLAYAQSKGWTPTPTIPQNPQGPTPPQPPAPEPSITGIPAMDELLKQAQDSADRQRAAGKILNPNIPLDYNTLQRFINDAAAEFSPYYREQFDVVKEQVNRGLQDLQKSYELQRQESEAQFKQQLATSREQAAGAGMTFSGVRGGMEKKFEESTNRSLLSAAQNQASRVGDLLRQTEGMIGTSQTPYSPTVNRSLASVSGQGGFETGTMSSDYSPLNITGSLERERLMAQKRREQELENAYRLQQANQTLYGG